MNMLTSGLGKVVIVACVAAIATPVAVTAQADPLPYCAEEGVSWGVGPTLLTTEGETEFGARLSLRGCKTGHDPSTRPGVDEERGFPRSHMWRFDVDLLVADPDAGVPESSSIQVGGGWSWSFSKRDRRMPRDWDINTPFDGGGYNRGFLDLGATAGYESSADWDEQNFTAGAQLRYATNAPGPARLLPSLVASVDVVQPASSEARADANLGKSAYGRWNVRGYWNTKLDFLSPGLESIRLQADLAVFQTFGLEQALVDAGWNRGWYRTVSLRYARRQAFGPFALTGIYVKYAKGEWPTVAGTEDAFTAGVSISVGR